VRIVLSDPKEFNANVEINGNMMILSTAEGLKATKSARAEKSKDQKSGRNRRREQDSEPQISTIDDAQGAKTASVAAGKIYKSTKGKLIVIDPGHGGSDSGAVGNGLKEKNVVLTTSKKLGALLTKRGYKVLYTRSTDVFINLRSRTAFAAKRNADMFISIHANAAPNASSALKMSGVETFFLSPARSERSKNAAALENRGDLEDMNTFSKQTFLNFLNREKIISSNKLAIDIQSYMLSSVKKSFSSRDGGVRAKTMPLPTDKWDLIPLPDSINEHGQLDRLYRNTVNQPYDWFGAVGVVGRGGGGLDASDDGLILRHGLGPLVGGAHPGQV